MNAKLSASANTVRYGQAYGVTVSESRFAPRLAIGEHTHRTGYLAVTLAGSVADTIVSREIVATPGYCCYVPPDTPHANTFGESGARCMLAEIEASALGFLEDCGRDVTTPWTGFGAPGAWHGLAFYRLLRHGAATSLDCEEFVLRAFERHTSKAQKRNVPPAWLTGARERLDAELKRPPSLAMLASDAEVHPMHLIRVFRTHVGCSPGEFVQTRRIAHACVLLLDSDMPLARVATHLGYFDQSHFNRAFRSRVGIPPGAYRNGG